MGICDCCEPTTWNELCTDCNNRAEDEYWEDRDSITAKTMTNNIMPTPRRFQVERDYRITDLMKGGDLVIGPGEDSRTLVIRNGPEQMVEVSLEMLPTLIDILRDEFLGGE